MTSSGKWSPWPYAIISTFILLAGFDSFVIFKAVQTRTGTVSDAPYDDALKYESIIQAKQSARDAGLGLKLFYNQEALRVKISGLKETEAAKYHLQLSFVKPEKPEWDRVFKMESGDGTFEQEGVQIPGGLWFLTATLRDENGKEFIIESKEMVNYE